MITTKPNTIDEYIAGFPKEVQKVLEQVRVTIKKVAPDAAETISYAMPTFTLNKAPLVYFAAFKNILAFMLYLPATKLLKKNFQLTKQAKAPFNSN